MAPAAEAVSNNNWLSFSLSPMDMFAHSHHPSSSPHILPSPFTSHQYFLDSFYSPEWGTQQQQQQQQHKASQGGEQATMGMMYTEYMVDHHPLDNNNNHNNTSSSTVPKLEDFFGNNNTSNNNNNNTASYNSQQTESTTQDSSQLTHFYDNHHHNYFADHHHNNHQYNHHNNNQQDLNAMTSSAGFQANSGSEVDDSGASTQLPSCVEFVAQSIEPDFAAAVSNAVNGGSLSLAVAPQVAEKSSGVVAVVESDNSNDNIIINNNNNNSNNNNNNSVKKVSDTFGQRTSIYRGVTRHRWTGRYEAHLWDNSCRREGQARKGRQVYLGGYDKEEKAARSYDLAALKYWGPTATTNFPVSDYTKELEDMKVATKQEFIASLRRKSSGFSRGASIYRGVTRHHQQGRWQARIGRVAGNKDLYLGTFATEEEAAEAYDIAAIKFRGVNAVTNFEMNRYDVDAILNSNLPVGGAAKRLKLATESSDQKPLLTLNQHPHSVNHGSPGNSSTINFSAIQPTTQMTCTMPFDNATAFYHQNLLQHLSSNAAGHAMTLDGFGPSAVAAPMSLMAQTPAEFYIWPHQSY